MAHEPSISESQPTPAASRSPARLWETVIVVFLLAAVVAGFLGIRHHEIEEKKEDAAPSTPVVAVTKVDREDLYNEVTISAEFRPYVEVSLNAKVAGYVDKMNVDFGDKVKGGQLLATLVVPELNEELEAARAAQERTKADYTNAHLVYTRLQGVIKDQPNLVAQQEVDTAESKDSAAFAALAASKADVARYTALVDYTNIVAPFDGVVTARFADPGELIQAGTSSDTQARALVRISDNYRLRLDFPVSVTYVKDIHTGNKVEVRVQSLDNKPYTGEVTRFTDRVNSDTRTMITEIEVPNPNLELVPGMYAAAVLKVDKRDHALSLPMEAVTLGAHPTVYLVNGSHEIEERPVVVGVETSARCEIVSGLSEGDVVMVGGRTLVHPGEKVEAKEWKAPEMPGESSR